MWPRAPAAGACRSWTGATGASPSSAPTRSPTSPSYAPTHPSDVTRRIIGALMTDGRVRRAYLGIAGGARPLPPRVAGRLAQRDGIEVIEVVEGSPAAKAGLRPEDLLVELDGTPLHGVTDLQRLMTSDAIDAPMRATVVRDGDLKSVVVTPAELRG